MALSKQTNNNTYGGLKVGNKNEINNSLFCGLCELLLLEPTQLLCCGIRLCRGCSKRGLSDSQPFVCSFCQTKTAKKEAPFDRGAAGELNVTRIKCYLCSWDGLYKNYKNHLQQNHADFECTDCHECFFAINSFEEHRQEICNYRCIPCGLPGCMEVVKWSEMKEHYLRLKHQKLLLEFIYQYFFPKKRQSNHLITTSSHYSQMQQELAAIKESIVTLLSVIETLVNDCTRLKSEFDQTKTNCEQTMLQINETRKTSSENDEKLMNYERSQNETEKEINDANKLLLTAKMSVVDSDGTVTFSFNKLNHEINVSFSFFSSIFKTSSYGYSFILRICSTIEPENGTEEYLSIFISLVPGDFDNILVYPFPYNISLCLCDQSEQRKHITSTIISNPNSPSFARPKSARNAEIGTIKFCPLKYLRGGESVYVKDDVFFIRVYFDFMNTGLNPFN